LTPILACEEGTFVICSSWPVFALAEAGDVELAAALFAKLTSCAKDFGPPGQKMDTASGEPLGSFPQALSHIGLITAAWGIDKARQRVS
jgi:GH15 family glucan-1,4-alpha-glucosidase